MNTEPLPAHVAAIETPSPLLYFRYHTMRYRFDAERRAICRIVECSQTP
jgi:hypothetical protein